ncbi:MAG: fibronectin type III domain-containing protein [Flavobacteriales bacterium]|nr:fibronectin type III domain-containing protein [Flavobacteriales bacterium]
MKRPFRLGKVWHALLVLAALMLMLPAWAQRTCSTMEVLQQEIADDPERAIRLEQIESFTQQFVAQDDPTAERAVVTIPVVFHVVWNTAAQNIPDSKLLSQLQQLNEDFARLNSDANQTPALFASLGANTEVQFCMAQRDPSGNPTTGIVRRQTTVTAFSSNNAVKYTANGGSNAWNRDHYLNIWVCNLSGGLLGYAQFPGGAAATDGVVVLFSSVGSLTNPGTASPFHYGRTLTHEVGHWLNLRHIWGDATCGNDLVADTPVHNAANSGCPSYPHYSTCSGTPVEMTMNYMDYSNDGCMNIFTLGQKSRMQALFATGGSRVSLLNSQGCVPPGGGGTCNTPSGLAASGITSSAATLSWSAVGGATGYSLQYKLNSSGTWTTVNVAGTSSTITGLSANTAYNARVATVCSGSTSAYSTQVNFTTAAAGCSDALEPNNTTGTAPTITLPASINALIASNTDVDYYRFTLGATSNISITLGNLPADFDLRLLNGSGSQLAISQAGGTTSESITYNNAAAGTYFIHVFGYNGAFSATQCYALNASATAVQTCNTPTGLAASGITASAATLSWNAVSGATGYSLQYKLNSAGTWTTVNVAGTSSTITGLSANTAYNARVATVCAGSTSAYGTQVNFTTASAGCTDTWESNNTTGTAPWIPVNTNIQALIGSSSDNDWYKFNNTSSQPRIRIDLTTLPADYDVRLFRGTSTQVGISQNGGTANEVIILNTTTVATYYIRVYGYNGAFNTTQCYTLRASISASNFREGELDADALEAEMVPESGLMGLYPNPANDKVMLDYLAGSSGDLQLQIFDGMGRLVLTTRQTVDEGPSTFGIPLPELANGMYVLHILEGEQRHQQRFMVQR